ncbi:MAG: hypothetical protein AB8B51_11725 [Sedimentitalea sp.]
MSAQIKGWCPDAHRPMMAEDGLILRLRPPLGRLTPDQAFGLADLCDRFGAGSLELTSRASLQLRGLSRSDYPSLLSAVQDLQLAPRDRRAIPPLTLNPFDRSEQQARLATALSAQVWPDLPSKFGLIIDAAPGQRHMSTTSGDIRIEAGETGMILRADGAPLGVPFSDAIQMLQLVRDLAEWFVSSGGIGPDGRGRMARHLHHGAQLPEGLRGTSRPARAAAPAVPGSVQSGVCVAVPFGVLRADHLRALALADIRLTPFRMVFVDHLPVNLPDDLIIDPDDPMLRTFACTGAPNCAQAQIKTRMTARSLAATLPKNQTLHISGCTKGCAHPKPADLTVVGVDGRFDLVRGARPWDVPIARAMNQAELERELARYHGI